jgi:CheY-like chemotaxis protein
MNLLLVDDDEAVRTTLGAVLEHYDFSVTSASTVPEALELIGGKPFDVLLADLNRGQRNAAHPTGRLHFHPDRIPGL